MRKKEIRILLYLRLRYTASIGVKRNWNLFFCGRYPIAAVEMEEKKLHIIREIKFLLLLNARLLIKKPLKLMTEINRSTNFNFSK